ncbi:rhomboid family intramembrane serine protease [Tenacibaculum finnmarkense genomovar finnmarkense]|uniref:rhomboid family intramembrane serine protease n=1 Tax=Tenacibaculum finnmarkense TaxID=2781243 RepID=UPI001E6553CB|nr:rhomboid family intramembrane serine protease [Tenacibaculum finnmarkense]MCD8417536.1 rhomboid family intramembrane serine protease [Tenacibaculum finnmarkense genomovar finnmarkense]MCG8185922.1 rhomboid family intramembrane serine protease [Tenacibaculum finnmarkense genomovar finnmarkense]MCG8202473.1 rhomboid family intramembrane serine protease [Tenacibaculum finnmarkense genomovar finnmarkense]MCG8209965.1 rhomboid family intramembrane serine protease [Tenacibaculum finnmarkense genom
MSQIILLLIAANVLVSYKGFNDITFFNRYKFQIQQIVNGDKIRMLTSGFLHADWMHLGFNMYALYLFGKTVLGNFSTPYFLLIYFGSLFAGSLYSLYQHKNDYYYSAVGASGAVSGIVFSAIILYPDMTLIMFPIPLPLPGYVFGIGYLLYSIYGMKNQADNVGHSAHLGGAIGGYLLTLLLKPSVISNNPLMIGVIGAIIVGLFLFGDKLKVK